MNDPSPAPRPTAESVAVNPRATGLATLDLAALFGNDNPVILEIGSGKGRFLVRSAEENPSANILGIEKSLHYHRVIVDRIVRRGITNVRAINYDAFPVLREMLPPKSIHEIHIYFPDPWPRPREQKRRIIRPETALAMERVLRDDGTGWYVTDHESYFDAAVPVLAETFAIEAGEVRHDPPRTNYEAKYQKEGRPIYQVVFRKRARGIADCRSQIAD
jgi:tRNA (guanine-N7-)-methyltransferase